jgi:protein kinase-like protein
MGESVGRPGLRSSTSKLQHSQDTNTVTPQPTPEVKPQETVQQTGQTPPTVKSESTFGNVSNETVQQKLPDPSGLNYGNLNLEEKTARAPRKRGQFQLERPKLTEHTQTTNQTQPTQTTNQTQPTQTTNQTQPTQQTWNVQPTHTGGVQRQQMLDPTVNSVRGQLGKLDTQINRLQRDITVAARDVKSQDEVEGMKGDLRKLKKANTDERNSIEQAKQDLPRIGGAKAKKEIATREKALEQMEGSAQKLEKDIQTQSFLSSGLKEKQKTLATVETGKDLLERMTDKLARGQTATPFELHQLRQLSQTEGNPFALLRETSTTLIQRHQQIPGSSEIANIPKGTLTGAARGESVPEAALKNTMSRLLQSHPDLGWAVTVRQEADVKGQLLSSLPGGLNLTENEQLRLVDTMYQALVSSGNRSSQDQSKITLDGKEYKHVKELGRGGAGVGVHLYEDLQDPKNKIAVKVFNPIGSDYERGRVLQELDGHRKAVGGGQHQNVTDFKGVVRLDDNRFMLCMECVDGGDMRGVTDRLGKSNLTQDDRLHATQFLMKGAVSGMQQLHGQGMMHLDVKPENFLLDSQTLQAKVSDFGLGHDSTNVKLNFTEGTQLYMSPQQTGASERSSSKVGTKDDVWSLGVMMHEMIEGRSPFPTFGFGAELAQHIEQWGANPNNRVYQDDGGQPHKQLINQMMHPDPAQRPSLDQVLQHPFFRQNLGTDLHAQQLIQNLPK